MRYIVQVQPGQLDKVLSQMKQLGITPAAVSFGFITTPDIPPQVAAQIGANMGVVNVRAETQVRIAAVAIESKLSEFVKLARNPLTLPQAVKFAQSADVGQGRTPTSISRKMVGADYAESIGITGKGIKVAVIDTGIAPTPQGFTKYKQIVSTIEGQPIALDDVGHGVWVATCINGNEYKAGGAVLRGVAPDAEVGVIKCLGYIIGAGTDTSVLKALEAAQKWGADIISASLGGEYTSDDPSVVPQCVAIKQLVEAGIIVVFANGNSGPAPNTVGVPANEPSAISVGSIDVSGVVSDFSSRGPTAQGVIKPDLVAPGQMITSCTTGWIAAMQLVARDWPGTGTISGTSMACPHAAATIALALQYARANGKNLKSADIMLAMSRYGDLPGSRKDNSYGHGLLTFQRLQKYIDENL